MNIFKSGGVLHAICVNEKLRDYNVGAHGGLVGKIDDERGLGVLVIVIRKLDRSVNNLFLVRLFRWSNATPKLTRFKGLNIKARDDTKIAKTTLQSLPEIRIALCIRLDNASIS